MKYKYIIPIIISFFFFSCEKELDITPETEVGSDNFFESFSDIEQIVSGAYNGLQSDGLYGFNIPFLGELRSDNSYEEALSNNDGTYGQIDVFDLSPINPVLDTTWKDAYICIQQCNIVLNRIETIPEADQDLKNSRTGEVLFIRALTYFNLVRLFGDVPLVTIETTDTNVFFGQGRTAASEVYNQIIKDLTEAISKLPATQSQAGRVTNGAASALLGKVYLTLRNYPEAIANLNNVSGYSLLPNYADIFDIENENNAESIFEVQFKRGVNNAEEGSPYATLFRVSGTVPEARGNNHPTQDLYNAFEAGDVRRDASIAEEQGVRYTLKYIDPGMTVPRDGENNLIVIRYADVVLMLAEALNEQEYQPNGQAFDLLNQIRNRAGLASLDQTDLPDKESFRIHIANERRVELNLENHRWFDLVRTGKAVETMNAHNSESGNFTIDSNKLLYPIPQSQINTDNSITQNTGY
ncbi:RagB/SusD family nutrient uptake outer membrane protein [Aquimarina longa]|uniref:RagB/SusD family nutrient uptake outer membrane protein n=1 Tax=Aquimarina longa TaxID=1080221 RepID=UPI0007833599|nr:RagB/SusD family nutrient uptake outer membrane protein [Aquimarina longa]